MGAKHELIGMVKIPLTTTPMTRLPLLLATCMATLLL